ncbi:MAG: hypothetical protein VYD19_09650, partial [Myxococcota bacterium]|nr:hypothetical protein [Myxococcota bacterium]
LREKESGMERPDCDRVERGIPLGPLMPGQFIGCEIIIDERPELPLALNNGQNRPVVLRYKPEGPVDEAPEMELVIESNALDEKVSVVSINFEDGEPQLVAEQVISFPSEGGDKILPLRNQGNGPLTISSVQIAPITPFYVNPATNMEEPEFVWDSADGSGLPFMLEPANGVVTLRVSYSPQDEGVDEAELVIRSNDPLRSEYRIKLTSAEISGTIAVEPSEVNFMGAGQQLLVFQNSGERTVDVFGMRIEPENAGFSLDANRTTSFQIPGGAQVERPVVFQPMGDLREATLYLETNADNAPSGELMIPLSAE